MKRKEQQRRKKKGKMKKGEEEGAAKKAVWEGADEGECAGVVRRRAGFVGFPTAICVGRKQKTTQ